MHPINKLLFKFKFSQIFFFQLSVLQLIQVIHHIFTTFRIRTYSPVATSPQARAGSCTWSLELKVLSVSRSCWIFCLSSLARWFWLFSSLFLEIVQTLLKEQFHKLYHLLNTFNIFEVAAIFTNILNPNLQALFFHIFLHF